MKKIITTVATITLALVGMSNKASAQCTTVHDFSVSPDGANPQGDLYYDGTYLYGTTAYGGTIGNGLVFKVKPDGSGYDTLQNFRGTATSGSLPQGSLISAGGVLYGMTYAGGTANSGTIFKINPNGTGYDTLHSFITGATGNSPYGSLISVGNFLYGTTYYGGINNTGVIFKIMPNGTMYDTLHSFGNGSDGSYPYGSLYSDGTFLYGMTSASGTSGNGLIFKIKPDGTAYDTLLNFNGTNGANPRGSLISDGTFLYGMTVGGGGAFGDGLIFKIKPNGTMYDTLKTFNPTTGIQPYGSLILNGGILYGMTNTDGANSGGTIFKINTDGSGFTDLYDFGSVVNDGYYPYGSLVSDGTCFYGTTYQGSANNVGTVFKYCDGTTGISKLSVSNEVSIYPNPSNGSFVIETNNNSKQTVNVYDVNGKLVLSQTISGKTTIDASILNEGVYNISLMSNECVINKRIVIVR